MYGNTTGNRLDFHFRDFPPRGGAEMEMEIEPREGRFGVDAGRFRPRGEVESVTGACG